MSTPQDVINGARELLQDPAGASPRWTDDDMIRWLAEALGVIWEDRPDVRYDDDGDLFPFEEYDNTELDDEMFLGVQWLPKLVDYVCYRCYFRDAADPENLKLSNKHYDHFREGLGIDA